MPAPLPERPEYFGDRRRRLLDLFESTSSHPPGDLVEAVRNDLGIDLSTHYGGVPITSPVGKGSGQLSFKVSQVESDVDAGLGFVVLKTVIAEDAEQSRTMEEWATPESQMKVERRTAPGGEVGWTVTWEGRGWSGGLAEYLEFFRQAQTAGNRRDIPVIPSVKLHLPVDDEQLKQDEYAHTVRSLLSVWDDVGCEAPMVIEKDFSPTLAGDERATKAETVLRWLREVPAAIKAIAPGRVRLGVKIMNALFGHRFQVDMVKTLLEDASGRPDFLTVFNRLFDPRRGVAFGGWELSYRNLEVLDALRSEGIELPPLSATGNICSGKMLIEYARRGCENGQLHTFFQLPLSEYTATGGSRSARAMHTLLLHHEHGLVAWLWHLNQTGALPDHDGMVRFRDLVARHRA